jgi:hypothetical protein
LLAKGSNNGKTAAAVSILLCVCSLFALGWGMVSARAARGVILDFRIIYYGARCLVQGHDPYNENELLRIHFANGGEPIPKTFEGGPMVVAFRQVYLPSAEMLIAPFGLLPWPRAYLIWIILTACGVTAAAVLMLSVARRYAESPPFYLISFLLINSGVLFSGGNPAGVAVSLCVIAVWCFLQNRFLVFGAVCMAVSLAIKPHDGGLVWLYFLLAGGTMRRHALKALFIAAFIGVFALAWIQQISPHWLHELQSNLREYAVRGSYADPGPTANKTIGAGMMINLQTVTSVIRDDPRFYGPAAYLLCAPFLTVWGFLTVRSRFSVESGWFALGTIAPWTMLLVYHRPYDAKLLLLTIPMCAILCRAQEGAALISVFLTALGIVFTSDLPLALLAILTKGMSLPLNALGATMEVFIMRPASLALLALGVFNLVQYARLCRKDPGNSESAMSSLSAVAANGQKLETSVEI